VLRLSFRYDMSAMHFGPGDWQVSRSKCFAIAARFQLDDVSVCCNAVWDVQVCDWH